MNRYLTNQIKKDLKKKMVFVGGPRQVGKTTLAKTILGKKTGYLRWDVTYDRERILLGKYPTSKLWVFDELHKYRPWRNYLKGLFDSTKDSGQQILVTGSARLDYYRFGGDSLQGRYHYLRLHPFSVAELDLKTNKDFLELLKLSGFPEPYLGGSETEAKRWSREYRTRLLRDEIRDLESVKDIGKLELLMLRLPDLVGSPLSLNSLRENLEVDYRILSKWVEILERLYAIFRIPPFGADTIRAVKKEQKHYHFDWTNVKEPSFRFENLVACHLLKWVHYNIDTLGRELELRYFRDVYVKEVDFVVMEDQKPIKFVECKWNDTKIDKGLTYLKSKFPNVESWQISAIGKEDYVTKSGIRVVPALKFLKELV